VSQSPADPQANQAVADRRSPFRRQLARLDQLLEDGQSWSGNERNCAFLNLGPDPSGQVRFATVSAVTGLDFLDDGRAHALADWDLDGDLDIWTTNRTAPRLRLLRNEAGGDSHFLALRLIGRQCHRDAIGARVEVVLADHAAAQPLVRSLRAGEGFLAQSTKWLHFGLGQRAEIDSVIVHWPGGQSERIGGLKVDGFYQITQGEGGARRLPPREASRDRLGPASLAVPPETDAAQILLSSRLPLPRIPWQRLDGAPDDSNRILAEGQAVWLNLWASWCVPCLDELQEATARAEQLRAAGLNVLALSLDGFEQPGAEPTTADDARRVMQQLNFPFDWAVATAETLRRLQFADRQMFGRQTELALPTSYLLTADGQLAAIYRGPVTVDRLLADAAHLTDDDPTLLESALPFRGVWFDGRRRYAPIGIVADLMDHRALGDALDYVRQHRADLAHQPGFVEVVGLLGTALAQQDRLPAALEMYRAALQVDPQSVAVLNNMAWHLATYPDAAQRNPAEAVRHAQEAAKLTGYRAAAILDTLAASYAAAGQTAEARQTLDQAIALAEQQGQTQLAERLRARRSELKP
jgi:tetratricopeptide (TPR) repeat protein